VAWDVTLPDTFADSHLEATSAQAGSAANSAENSKTSPPPISSHRQPLRQLFLGTNKPLMSLKRLADASQ